MTVAQLRRALRGLKGDVPIVISAGDADAAGFRHIQPPAEVAIKAGAVTALRLNISPVHSEFTNLHTWAALE